MNVPKLRFKEFNDEYKKVKLNTQCEFLNGLTYTPSDVSDNGIIVLRSSNIQNSRINYNDIVRVNLEIPNKLKIYENDILMCVRNGSKNLVGKTAWLSKKEENCTWGAFMNVIRPFEQSKYIYYFLNSNYFNNHVWKDLGTATVNQITKKTLDDCYINLPNTTEQIKVSNFLSLLDKKIELQSKKIEDLKLFKKGLSTTLFNSFDNYNEEKLGNLCEITTGKLDANAMVENGKYRFYTCAKNYSFINDYAFDTEALLISGNGAYVGYIHYYKGKFNAYQRTYVLDNFKENIQYIKCYLDENLSKRINSEKKEGNTPYIVLSTLSDMKIKIPNPTKQNEISYLINNFNNKMIMEESKLDKLQELKKGLMQNMFV